MKRKKLRIDRILYCLIFFILLIFLIKFSINFTYNLILFNGVKKNEIITINKSEVKVWKKTVNYIHENMENVTIKHKKNYITISSNDFKNGLKLDTKIYNKTINEKIFSNQKTYYIENNELIKKSSKLKIKMVMNYMRKVLKLLINMFCLKQIKNMIHIIYAIYI